MLAIVCRSVVLRRHYYDLVEDLRLLCDTIQAEIPHLLALIAEAAHVIVIAVPDQRVRTNRIRIAVVCDIALLCDIEIGVVERDLPLGIDRFVDCIDQHLELRQFIYMSIIVVLVLRRLIVLDMKAAVMEHSKIITDRVREALKE